MLKCRSLAKGTKPNARDSQPLLPIVKDHDDRALAIPLPGGHVERRAVHRQRDAAARAGVQESVVLAQKRKLGELALDRPAVAVAVAVCVSVQVAVMLLGNVVKCVVRFVISEFSLKF